MPSLKLSLELLERGGNASYSFAIVAADHATTMTVLDSLSRTRYEILNSAGFTLEFPVALNALINNRGKKIPENIDLAGVHLERNRILHHGVLITKKDSIYYLKNTYDFLKRFLAEEYKKKIPKSIQEKAYLLDSKPKKFRLKRSLTDNLSKVEQHVDNPMVFFSQSFASIEVLLKILGYRSKILRKGASFNQNNVYLLKDKAIITKTEMHKLQTAMKMKKEINSSKIIHTESEFAQMNNFLKILKTKLSKHTKTTLAQELEEFDLTQLVELALNPKRERSVSKGRHK